MIVVIAEAAHCENAGCYGYEGATHKVGNQTGEELRRYAYYNMPFQYVFRWKNKNLAKEFAKMMVSAVLNTKFGYSQPGRWLFGVKVMKRQDPAKVKTKCDTDCSKLVNTLAKLTMDKNNVKTAISGDEVTAQMPEKYNNDPNFINVTGFVNLVTGEGLEVGDILVTPEKHTAAVTQVFVKTKVGRVKKYSGVYTQPKVRKKYHTPGHSFLGEGNLIEILESDNKNFYFCNIAGVVGYVLKKRVDIL